jgi:hypothetical protein
MPTCTFIFRVLTLPREGEEPEHWKTGKCPNVFLGNGDKERLYETNPFFSITPPRRRGT